MSTQIAKAYVQILPTTKGIGNELNSQLGGELSSAGTSGGKSLGSSIVGAAAKVFAAAKVGQLIGNAMNEGAALEQSVGGIETLFKDSADTMIGYANEAFKTAGLSANDYMETATSFAASLLQGTAGNTQLAAEVANQAIIDMSDNANKMGTDMSSIQNAYQGFAKQNYTMLDNLKLGYGGTKTEMERLLKDAQALSGVEYNIDNLADVYNAIHVIQQNLDITGTTAKEASTTFTGSMNAMKSAFSNVLAQIATGGDVGPALNGLVETVSTFVKDNLLPMLANIVTALPQALPQLIESLAPSLIETGVNMLISLSEGFIEGIPQFVERLPELIDSFINGITKFLPEIAVAGVNLIVALVTNLPKIIATIISKIPDIIKAIVNAFVSKKEDLAQAGMNLLRGLADGLARVWVEVWNTAQQIATNLVNGIRNMLGIHSPSTVFAGIGANMMLGLTEGIEKNEKHVASALNDVATLSSGINMSYRAQGSYVSAPMNSGAGAGQNSITGSKVAVFNLNGREFMRTVWEDAKAVEKEHGLSLISSSL